MIASRLVDDLSRRREARDAARLALIPLGVAFALGVLLLPRRAEPDVVPLPIASPGALAQAAATDRALAEQVRRQPLSGAVRALGSKVRDFHTLEASGADAQALFDARRAVDAALVEALPGGVEPIAALRAVQLEAFLVEVGRFEATGEVSPELGALAGNFVRSMTAEGWCEGHVLAPQGPALRAMFKHMWNAFLGLDARAELRPSLDEERSLYAFYLSHPHPSRQMRDAIDAARRGARDAKSCKALDEAERGATEAWRLQHIGRLAAIDPAYPADYARGVSSYRKGDFGASASAFRKWLTEHPEGPYSLRAATFLRAASAAERTE